jgi:hypothetical protein
MNARDFGYRPAVGAIVDRLKEQLADKCLNRELSVRKNEADQNEAACVIVEAKRLLAGEMPDCSGQARGPIAEAVDSVVRQQLEATFQCDDAADCAAFQLCEIEQLTADRDPGGYETCLKSDVATGDGWCYVDPAKGLPADNADGSNDGDRLVEKCPSTAKRKLRFVGFGTPKSGTVTFVACAGAAFQEE